MAERKINYGFFIAMGVSLAGLGLIFMLTVNTVVGVSMLAVGLGNIAIGLSGKRKDK